MTRWTGGALAVLALAAVVLVLARPPPPAALDDASDPALGREDAPVTVYYFADFQCPACRAFELGDGMRLLEAEAEAGRVRLVFKDFPFLSEDSTTAARASQFVWSTAPDAYWGWHRALYEAQGPERSGWASAPNLVAFSRQWPQIDADALADALAGDAHADEVAADLEAGRDRGVRSTPTVVVGDRLLNPNEPGALEDAIEAAAREAGGGADA